MRSRRHVHRECCLPNPRIPYLPFMVVISCSPQDTASNLPSFRPISFSLLLFFTPFLLPFQTPVACRVASALRQNTHLLAHLLICSEFSVNPNSSILSDHAVFNASSSSSLFVPRRNVLVGNLIISQLMCFYPILYQHSHLPTRTRHQPPSF